jgi:hypothetical protein
MIIHVKWKVLESKQSLPIPYSPGIHLECLKKSQKPLVKYNMSTT